MKLQKIFCICEILSMVLLGILSIFLVIFSHDISKLTNYKILNAEAPLSYIINLIILCILINIYLIRNKEYFLKYLKIYILYFLFHWTILFFLIKLFGLPYNVFNGSDIVIYLIPVLSIIYLLKRFIF